MEDGASDKPRKPKGSEKLPAELKYKIMKLLPAPDVRNLMLASRAFCEAARRILYESVIYRVNSDGTLFKEDLAQFKKAGAQNLSLVKNLAITNTGFPKSSRPLPKFVERNHVGVWRDDASWREATRIFNLLLISILERTTRLKSFRSSHTLAIAQPTLEKLVSTCPRIENIHVRLTEPLLVEPNGPIVKHQLKSIGCRGSYDYHFYSMSIDVVASIFREVVEENADTLEEMVLGQESFAVQAYKSNHYFTIGAHPWHFNNTVDTLPGGFPKLTKLDLICACVRYHQPENPTTLTDHINFSRLRRLSLESCIGVEDLLATVSAIVGPGAISLKEFRLRHEETSEALLRGLEEFICSFSGLEVLSILIDNTDVMPQHEKILQKHGPTLKALVWEGRRRRPPRGSVTLEARNEHRSFLECLPRYCRQLQELSIPLDVNISYSKETTWHRIAMGTPFGVLGLPHLTTLHIRVLPAINRLTVDPFLILHANKSAVAKFLDWGSRHRKTYPNLKLVAVGQLTYEDRFVLDRPKRMRSKVGPARPFFFDVTAHQNMLGSYDHMLQPVGRFESRLNTFVTETIESIQEDYSNTRVFDSYWLK